MKDWRRTRGALLGLGLLVSLAGCVDIEGGYISKLQITSDGNAIVANGIDVTQLSAFGNQNTVVTSKTVFSVNGTNVSQGFTTLTPGDNVISATYTNPDGKVIESNSITISAAEVQLSLGLSRPTVPASGCDEVTIIAKDQNGTELSKGLVFYADDAELESNAFSTTKVGAHDIKATFNHTNKQITSSVLKVTATEANTKPTPTHSARRVLIEEFTGAWCGWCPQGAYNAELLHERYPEVLAVGLHVGDRFQNSFTRYMGDNFNSFGYPYAMVDGIKGDKFAVNANDIFSESWLINILERKLKETPKVDIGIDTEVTGNNATVDVSVYFHQGFTDDLYLSVYILEDSLREPQQNYFAGNASFRNSPFFSEPATMNNYLHHHVVRGTLTGNTGVALPLEEMNCSSLYNHATLDLDVNQYVNENVSIMAVVYKGTTSEDRRIMNVSVTKLGEDHDLY